MRARGIGAAVPAHVRLRRLSFVMAVPLIAAGLALTGLRVYELEQGELEHVSARRTLRQLAEAPGSTRLSARITQLSLEAGEQAVFELCSEDRLEPERWLGVLELAVFRLEGPSLMLRVPLDRPHLDAAKRNSQGACLPLGSGPIEHAGEYSVDAVWPGGAPPDAVRGVALWARVLARTPLTRGDAAFVALLAAGIALALLGFALERHSPAPSTSAPVGSDASAMLWAAVALAALVGAAQLPLWGSTLGLAKGAIMATLQIGAALWLGARLGRAGTPVAPTLSLSAPQRGKLWWPAGAAAAVALVLTARLSLSLVPATSEAPIQTFVAWPSGLLSFAAIGVLLPVAEEVFFRGYLYRLALRFGTATAFISTLVLFTALHAQQSWGNWGGLVAIFFTGLVLTTLRTLSGSVLLPAATHLAYNLTLSMSSVL